MIICPCAQVIKHHAMETYGGVDVYIHVFLVLALIGSKCSAFHPGRFSPEERALGTHWIKNWVGPRTGVDYVQKRKYLMLL
jgi:hypothetical protein